MTRKDSNKSTRRRLLKTAGVVGPAWLTGCLSGGGSSGSGGSGGSNDSASNASGSNRSENGSSGSSSGSNNIVVSTSSDSTTVYGATQGIGAVVNKNTKDVHLDVRPSEGFAANMGILDRGEAQMAALAGNLAYDVINRNPPFDDLDFELTQVLHIHNTDWFLGSANEDWTSWGDIESNSKLSPAPNGTSVRSMMSYALGDVLDIDYQDVSIGFGDQGSALSSDRIDAGIGALTNPQKNPNEPSWVQQMKSVADLRVLGIPDDMATKLEKDPKITVSDVNMRKQYDGYAYLPKTADLLSLVTYLVAPASLSKDSVYTMLKTMWQNKQSLGTYADILKNHTDAKWWVADDFADVPFHPGAAKFYKEQGVWKDGFTTP